MDNTIWSLVPPILAIIMVLVTRRVLLSLGVGIIASAFFIASFNFPESFSLIWESFRLVFVEDNALNTGNVYILLFVLMLGIMTAFVSMMGEIGRVSCRDREMIEMIGPRDWSSVVCSSDLCCYLLVLALLLQLFLLLVSISRNHFHLYGSHLD